MRLLNKSSKTATFSLSCAPARFSTMMATLCWGAAVVASAANNDPAANRLAANTNWGYKRIIFLRLKFGLLGSAVGGCRRGWSRSGSGRRCRRRSRHCGRGLGIARRRRHLHRAAILIHQNVVRHLDGPAIGSRFRAPVADHVITRIERRREAVNRTRGGADAKISDITGGDSDGAADSFAGDRAGLIRAGMAIIGSRATAK